MTDDFDYGKKLEDGQYERHPVLPKNDKAKFIRPYRVSYRHKTCDGVTYMGRAIAETYARDPKYYTHTFCAWCKTYPVVSEFIWTEDGKEVGS